jgi:hypothetical protein
MQATAPFVVPNTHFVILLLVLLKCKKKDIDRPQKAKLVWYFI